MDDKIYLKLEKKIDTLIRKKNRIYFLSENCTTAMYDMHGVKACQEMEKKAKRHNEKSLLRIKKYDDLITEVLLLMLNSGYSIENIISKYDLTSILSKSVELSSYLNCEFKKRK